MRRYLLKCYIVLLTQIFIIKGVQRNNNSSDESRHPRGRIVKMYSGLKHEPITCNVEGFLADPINCSIFYRCIKSSRGKYTSVKFQCSPGTVYDPEIETCNHPQNTKRSECRSSRPFQYITAPVEQINDNDIEPAVQEIPSPIITRKPIYDKQTSTISELPNKPTHIPSPIPIAIQSSDYGAYGPTYQVPSTIKAQTNEITKTTEIQTALSSTVSTTQYPWTPPTNQYGSTTSTTAARLGNECVHDGFVGDTEDCRKFYRCVNDQRGEFKKFEFMCSESTIWDEDIQSCNHPWAVRHRRCGRDTSSSEFISKHEEYYSQKNNSLIERELSSYELNKTENPIKVNLPLSISNQINYGNRINFNQNNVWNNKNNVTDNRISNQERQTKYPIKEKETDYVTQSYETITKTSSYVTDEVKHGTSYGTNPSTYKVINYTCTESGFIGDPQDCTKFYRCVENGRGSYIRHEFQCGEGTAWDKNIESCNHVWMVKECGERNISNSFTSKRYDSENMYTTLSNIIKDDIASDNNDYSHQNDNVQHILRPTTMLPLVNQILNEPSELNGRQEICNSVGFMGNQNNCKIFYRCIENSNGGFTKFEYLCGEGTAWDPNIEACNHAEQVKHCGLHVENQTKASTSSTESTIITTVSFVQTTIHSSDNNFVNNVSYVSTNQRETTAKPFTTSQVLPNVENKCGESGFMADSYDCRKFYRCVDNGNGVFTRFEYLCGEGTVWDKNINACNHFWAVENCRSNHSNILNEFTPLPSSENDDNSYNNHTNDIYKDPIRSTERTTVVNLSNMTATTHTCINSGFIGDELDCKKFYRCVSNGDGSFKQYEFSCGEGTVWDPEKEACNHAWAVKKCGGSSSNQNEVSTTPSTTTIIITNNEFDSGYTTQSYNHTKLPVQNTIDLSTIKVPGSDKDLDCKTVGFMADKNDCKRFYRCVENGLGGFDRFDFSCGEGTVWDSNIQACNHALSVKDCGTGNYNTTTSSLIEITTQSMATVSVEVDKNIPGHSETESPTTIKTSYANITCTSDGFYGDENDCKKFYRCVINQQGGFFKYEFSCGEGTVWDQNIQACSHASVDNMNCKRLTANLITTAPTSIITPGSTERYTTSYLEGSSTQENSDYIPEMGNTCVSEGFYPNSKDCKKFFRCVNNGKGYIRYDFTCGEGTIWVQAIQACDHEIDNSTCYTESVNEGYLSTTPHTTSSHINAAHSEAPNTNMESNETSSAWNTQSKECRSEGYYEKANNCRQFYRCVLNDHGTYTKYDYICSEGTAWDVDKMSCNHIDTVKRCQSTNVQDIESTTVKQFEEETKTTEAIMTTRSSTLTPGSTPSKEDALNVAECKSEGYFGNKENCQKFYRCVDDGKGHFVKYDYICGDGTIWDQDILTCNHPRDVTNRSCDNGTTNASSTLNTEPSIQSTASVSSSFQSSSTPSMSTQTATSTTSTQSATISMSTQTATSSISTQTATSSMPTQTVTSSMPTQTATPSTSTQTNEGSSQETPICSQEGTSKNPKNQNITCTKAGYFANPSDCKKFYRCVDWDGGGQRFSVFHFECGEGTIWDPALDTCNYEESVYPPRNCGSTQAQNNDSSQTSTTDQTTRTESTTTLQPSSSETTSTQSTPTEGQTTEQQSSTNQMSSSTATPTDTTSTTMISTDTTSTTVAHTDITSTTVTPTDTTSTTYQTTSEQSTTDITTTQSDKSTTTTVGTSTSENTSSISEQTTISEKSTTTTEATTSMTEQQTSTTLEQSSTELPTTQTTVSATEETTLQGSTIAQQTSTESSTEVSNTSTTETSPTSIGSTTQSTETTTAQESSTVKDCPDTEDDQYLYACPTSFKRHPKYCNLFYQCIENNDNHELKIATFNCPNGTIYDESKIQCVEESKAEKKCQGIMAKNRRIKRLNLYSKETISVSEDKYGCSGVGHYPFEKNECSPAILKCETSKRGKVQGFVYRCPDNYIYWSVSRRCEPISMMTACKNSSNQWIGRSEIPIERKNVA